MRVDNSLSFHIVCASKPIEAGSTTTQQKPSGSENNVLTESVLLKGRADKCRKKTFTEDRGSHIPGKLGGAKIATQREPTRRQLSLKKKKKRKSFWSKNEEPRAGEVAASGPIGTAPGGCMRSNYNTRNANVQAIIPKRVFFIATRVGKGAKTDHRNRATGDLGRKQLNQLAPGSS